mmetsp:Transcript_10948/g.15408  ORF Transcript_10948/g.15408 Transcript_10948/m.15408 type:complete len:426 (-) Transcript_10948:1351-2628(-)
MKSFPTVYALANASEEEINSHWAGLGFYRRARLLHRGATYVVEKLDGNIPGTVDELMKIDGIGRYTASAIASIAFDQCVPVVDGNVCRVLSRLTGIANNIKAPTLKDRTGWRLAEQIVSAGNGTNAGDVNQALMELGATYCSPSGTGIDNCDPLKDFYISTRIGYEVGKILFKSDDFNEINDLISNANVVRGTSKCSLCEDNGVSNVLSRIANELHAKKSTNKFKDWMKSGHAAFPTPPPKKGKREEVLAVAVICCEDSKIQAEKWLMIQRPNTGLLAGQWEFPSSILWNSGGDKQKKKRKKENILSSVPVIPEYERQVALDEFLHKMCHDDLNFGKSFGMHLRKCTRQNTSLQPVEHIFSHVRHTMWIEYGHLTSLTINDIKQKSWKTWDGREIRWMTLKDMQDVGVTSGVKKVLSNVKSYVSQ